MRNPAGDPKRARVFVVVSRDGVLEGPLGRVVCAPVYSQRQGLDTEVLVGVTEGLKHDSVVLCDLLASVDKRLLTSYVGELDPDGLRRLGRALRVALAVE